MTRYLIALAVITTCLGGAYGKGWSDRGSREAARVATVVAERNRAAARVTGLVEALERTRAERDRLAEDLEDAALSDNDAARPAFGPDSVRRLNQR